MSKTILVTAACGGFGALVARALAEAGHTVYAGIPGSRESNAQAAADADAHARRYGVALRPVELDVSDQRSVDIAVARIRSEAGGIDVVVHSAGGVAVGLTESFTPYQLSELFDSNVVSTQRVNRAVLPHMRERGDGQLVWLGRGAADGACTPHAAPHVAPYAAAKSAMEHLARGYAAELAPYGIDSTIVVPVPEPRGTAGPVAATSDGGGAAEASGERYAGLPATPYAVRDRSGCGAADGPGALESAAAIVRIVAAPKGERPFAVSVAGADCEGRQRDAGDRCPRGRSDLLQAG